MNKEFDVQKDVALAPLTTLEVGGATRFFWEAKNEQEVLNALQFANKRDLPVFVLGGGSNLLVCDNGFHGLVLKIALKNIEVTRDKTDVFVTAAAGEDWDKFVDCCVAQNLAGIECLSGIPGTVGATPVQNVGAYGQEVSETILLVRALDRKTLEVKNLTNAECQFAYRSSIFNTSMRNRFIVLSVTFCLKPNGKPNLRYVDLQKYFAETKEEPNLQTARQAVLNIRAAKSMVISKADENHRSAGSFFKNPIVTKEKFAEIELKVRRLNIISADERIPHFLIADDKIKIPAAWLIEKSGFKKGYELGQAGISTRHTLAIINRGDASASDITKLMSAIQTKVKDIFDVSLTPEPVFLGFDS